VRLSPNVAAAAVVVVMFLVAALAMHHVAHRVARSPGAAAADTLAPVLAPAPPTDASAAAR
jgi:hypothetical protein